MEEQLTPSQELFQRFKEVADCTHSGFKMSDLRFSGMYFLYFNYPDQRVEVHSDKMIHFIKTDSCDHKTIVVSIPFDHLTNQPMSFRYDKDGKLVKIVIGFYKPVYEFTSFNKQTSHGKQKGLFIVKDAFVKYTEAMNSDN